jgi:hypothetical protein
MYIVFLPGFVSLDFLQAFVQKHQFIGTNNKLCNELLGPTFCVIERYCPVRWIRPKLCLFTRSPLKSEARSVLHVVRALSIYSVTCHIVQLLAVWKQIANAKYSKNSSNRRGKQHSCLSAFSKAQLRFPILFLEPKVFTLVSTLVRQFPMSVRHSLHSLCTVFNFGKTLFAQFPMLFFVHCAIGYRE